MSRTFSDDAYMTATTGEQCVTGKGGEVKGPAVWPRRISVLIAAESFSLCVVADLKFRVSEAMRGPAYIKSNP